MAFFFSTICIVKKFDLFTVIVNRLKQKMYEVHLFPLSLFVFIGTWYVQMMLSVFPYRVSWPNIKIEFHLTICAQYKQTRSIKNKSHSHFTYIYIYIYDPNVNVNVLRVFFHNIFVTNINIFELELK